MVPKVSFGSPVVKAIREQVPDDVVLDVKLGCISPEDRIREFSKAGADVLSFHPEATLQPMAVINEIESAGCAPGLVLNPGTSIETVHSMLEMVDVVVVMLVNPGWGGPKYMDAATDKIRALRAIGAANGRDPWIEVDGGVSSKNAAQLIYAGANALVAGGSVFNAEDKYSAIQSLRNPVPADVQSGLPYSPP
mmetsp:Transcript_419/g.729  ORF Transcript_419/g.729 Transcript_419/m.729 type:complete len:193 (-) Transcript_419:123-701(-)